MSLQYSESVRNAMLDVVESDIGTSAVLKIFSGSMPADCASANSGSELASMDLPVDWMSAAASGSKAKLGIWADETATSTGDAGHFRIYASDGATCHVQGTVSLAGGGGDMIFDNLTVGAGFPAVITAFTLTAPGA